MTSSSKVTPSQVLIITRRHHTRDISIKMSNEHPERLGFLQSLLVGTAAAIHVIKTRKRLNFQSLFDIEKEIQNKRKPIKADNQYSEYETESRRADPSKGMVTRGKNAGALVNCTDIRKRLLNLPGGGVKLIAEMTGMDSSTFVAIRSGRQKKMRSGNKERVFDALAKIESMVDSEGNILDEERLPPKVVRMIENGTLKPMEPLRRQLLEVPQYDHGIIAKYAGVSSATISNIRTRRHENVHARTYRTVSDAVKKYHKMKYGEEEAFERVSRDIEQHARISGGTEA